MDKDEGGFPIQPRNTTINSKNPIAQIPRELLEFVRRDTYSLLVKGDAGTGKTTLSLTILRALKIKTNFFYISTRLSPKQLFNYYPWLGKFVDTQNNNEITTQGSTQRTSYNAPSFEDARLDEPESLFERITNQLMDVKAPIIIIDSWDAVASFMDKEARLNNERVLQTWRERAGAKLIFISENPSDTTLDFLVDGIVNLTQKSYGEARIREMTLTKLRGIRINKSCYIFSLSNGGFKCYVPSDLSAFAITRFASGKEIFRNNRKKLKRGSYAVKSDLTNLNYVSSSYRQLDSALGGGFPKKSIVFLRAHSDVGTKVTSLLLAGMISNLLEDGNPIVIENSMEVHAELIRSYLRINSPLETKSDLLSIISSGLLGEVQQENSHSGSQKLSKSERVLESISDAMQKARRCYPDKLLVILMGFDACREIWQRSELIGASYMRSIFAQADLTFIVGRNAPDDGFGISDFDIHFYVQRIRGTLVLHPLVPETHPYAIVIERSSGYPNVKLESLT